MTREPSQQTIALLPTGEKTDSLRNGLVRCRGWHHFSTMSTAPSPDSSSEESDPNAKGRLGTTIDSAKQRVSLTAENLRQRSAIFDGFYRMWQHDGQVGGGLMAGALAFRLFLFLVPYVLFVFTALGTASEVATTSPTEMAKKAGIAGVLATGVVNTNTLTMNQKLLILVVAAYAMVMAARSVVSTIVASMCLVWQVPRIKIKKFRPAVLFIIFVTVVSWLTAELGQLRDSLPAPGIALTVSWLSIPLFAGWWLAARLPHSNAPTWALLPGSVVFAIGLQLMHVFTVVYIARSVTSKSETYGIVGISLATLLWCYVAGRLAVGTGVINAALWRRYERNHPDLAAIDAGDSQLGRRQQFKAWLQYSLDLFR